MEYFKGTPHLMKSPTEAVTWDTTHTSANQPFIVSYGTSGASSLAAMGDTGINFVVEGQTKGQPGDEIDAVASVQCVCSPSQQATLKCTLYSDGDCATAINDYNFAQLNKPGNIGHCTTEGCYGLAKVAGGAECQNGADYTTAAVDGYFIQDWQVDIRDSDHPQSGVAGTNGDISTRNQDYHIQTKGWRKNFKTETCPPG